MKQILIDTDVILDFLFDRQPFSNEAASVLSLCEAKKVKGYITPVICSNVYYILRKTARHEKVVARLSKLLTILDILSMDREIVLQALSSGFKDFEDALQHFTAAKTGFITCIVTRNVKDYAKSEIGVLSPEDFLKSFSLSH